MRGKGIPYALKELDSRLVLLLEREAITEGTPSLRRHLVGVDEFLGEMTQVYFLA
jgi:hypothetical protein